MFAIFDNLNATLIAMSIFLMIVGIQVRQNKMRLDQTATYMVKAHAGDLATWMEEDMLKLAQYMKTEETVPFANPQDSTLADGAVVTTEFTFFREEVPEADSSTTPVRMETRYRLMRTGSREVDDEDVDVFRVARYECAGAGCMDAGLGTESGGSTPALRSFRIQLLDRDARVLADPVAAAEADPEAVQNTRLQFSMLTPFDVGKQGLRQVYYGSTLLIAAE